jgi:hypothetical protein
VKDEENWRDLERYLVPGATIWFKATPNEFLVMQMRVKRAFDEKEIVNFDHVIEARKALPEALAARGTRFIWLGLAIVPAFALLRRSIRKRKREA